MIGAFGDSPLPAGITSLGSEGDDAVRSMDQGFESRRPPPENRAFSFAC